MAKGYSTYNQSGWKHSKASIKKMSLNSKGTTANEKNGRWKGLDVSYGALHTWIREHFGSPTSCEKCSRKNLTGGKIHWANISKKYLRIRSDWIRLCAKCHKKFDKDTVALLKRKKKL
jgi:hypothetical protein